MWERKKKRLSASWLLVQSKWKLVQVLCFVSKTKLQERLSQANKCNEQFLPSQFLKTKIDADQLMVCNWTVNCRSCIFIEPDLERHEATTFIGSTLACLIKRPCWFHEHVVTGRPLFTLRPPTHTVSSVGGDPLRKTPASARPLGRRQPPRSTAFPLNLRLS